MSVCGVKDCELRANRVGAGLCEKHYMRLRRNGSVRKKKTNIEGDVEHSGGYLLAYAPDHPLAEKGRRVYRHRVVYYDSYGEGPFKCHWCGIGVTWSNMHVDHLNDNKKDNRVGNLVASCPVCNQSRGQHKMIAKQRGRPEWQYTAHGKTMCLSEWSRLLGISRASLLWRMKAGWSDADVFSARKGNTGPKSRDANNA